MIYDTELGNTLNNVRYNTGSFQTFEDPEHGWMWKGNPNKLLGGTEVEINDKKYNITPGIQKVIVITSCITAKSRNDNDNVVFRDKLQKNDCYVHKPIKGRISGRD